MCDRRLASWPGVRTLAVSVTLALLGPAGCGGSSGPDNDSAASDGGGFERAVVGDTAGGDGSGEGGDGAGGEGVDAASSDGASDGGAGGDTIDARPDLNIEPSGATVTVTIKKPMAGDVIRRSDGFRPDVRVAISPPAGAEAGGSDPPTTNGTIAQILEGGMVVASATLHYTGTDPAITSPPTYVFDATSVDIGKVNGGMHKLQVTSETLGGATGTASVDIMIDVGPSVDVIEPTEGEYVHGSLNVQVVVDDPDFKPIKKVDVVLGSNAPVTLPPPAGAGGTGLYVSTLPLGSFDGLQSLQVRATNSNDSTTTVLRTFQVDNTGPTITDTTPAAGSLIGRVIEISAKVADPAGVLGSRVVAVVAHGASSFEVPLLPVGGTKFSALFDTQQLPIHAIYPTISYRAEDVFGNQSAVGYTVALDNTAPIADLEPRRVRVVNEADGKVSWPFDPVGPDAVDDGMLVPQLFDVRALIVDDGNHPLSGSADFTPIATVDPSRAQLFVWDDTLRPLVVDTDGDGICDRPNPLLKPSTSPMSTDEILALNLIPLTERGAPDYLDPGTVPLPKPFCLTTHNDAYGAFDGTSAHSTDLLYIMGSSFGTLPAIWTLPPVVADRLQDMGQQFDAYANNISDGWACLAAVATDKLGNTGVSKVMRVCIDSDGSGTECPHLFVAGASGSSGTSVTITTTVAHGLVANDKIIVRGIPWQPRVNGEWTVESVTTKDIVLKNSLGAWTDNLGAPPAFGATVVKSSLLPNCTGTQTSMSPVTVTSTPCAAIRW